MLKIQKQNKAQIIYADSRIWTNENARLKFAWKKWLLAVLYRQRNLHIFTI